MNEVKRNDYIVVKHIRSQFEALCLELMLSSNDDGRYVYYKTGDVSSFVGVIEYNGMTSQRYIEAIKPMVPDFMFRHNRHENKAEELWHGTELKTGVLKSFNIELDLISDMDRRVFRLRYYYNADKNLVLERGPIDVEDHDHRADEVLERGRQRVASVLIKPVSIRLVNEAVQEDFDDWDDSVNYLDNLEG